MKLHTWIALTLIRIAGDTSNESLSSQKSTVVYSMLVALCYLQHVTYFSTARQSQNAFLFTSIHLMSLVNPVISFLIACNASSVLALMCLVYWRHTGSMKANVALAFIRVNVISEANDFMSPFQQPWFPESSAQSQFLSFDLHKYSIWHYTWVMSFHTAQVNKSVVFFPFLSILIQFNISRMTHCSTWRRSKRREITDNVVHINATRKSTMATVSSNCLTTESITKKLTYNLICYFFWTAHNSAQNSKEKGRDG